MPRAILLMSISTGASLTNVTLGLLHALTRQGIRPCFFKPIAQPAGQVASVPQGNSDALDGEATAERDPTLAIIRRYSTLAPPQPCSLSVAEQLISQHKTDDLLEQIVARFTETTKGAAVVLIEGLAPTSEHPYANPLNLSIAKALNAELVLVVTPGEAPLSRVRQCIEVATASFDSSSQQQIAGIIVNSLDAPAEENSPTPTELSRILGGPSPQTLTEQALIHAFSDSPYPLLGYLPWEVDLLAARASDIARHLNATPINVGGMQQRRIKSIVFCAHSIPHMLSYFQPGVLLVTSADRADVILAASLATLNGIAIGALLLTGGYPLEANLQKMCARAFEAELPVFSVEENTWQTAINLQSFSLAVAIDDQQRIEKIEESIANRLCKAWISSLTTAVTRTHTCSPPAFRYYLTEHARLAAKRIVLPEGEEPRTIRAANLCSQRGIAHCVLLGNPLLIQQIAEAEGITLDPAIECLDPATLRERYLTRLLILRQHRGMIETVARDWLKDNVILATLMLEQGAVDGLVSGAVNTTANTIRPALQLLKTAPGNAFVSSVFFMLLPDQVLVYGDCAINPDPTAEQLAEIAIQSADSAAAFGIEPRVAMISYSTGDSGAGSGVDKVRTATALAKARRPDLVIDGPLQYDAAIMHEVAKTKAPTSPVAGRATVFIFPDLNTGNTTYKAVQRVANLVSIGPMLQGLSKPVNDLSRGASVDDIVYTIALTAIQAAQLISSTDDG